MQHTVGLLIFESAIDHLEWLAIPVQNLIKNWQGKTPVEEILATQIDPDFAGSAEFCEKYGVQPNEGANCIIVKGKRGEAVKYAACLVPVDKRADVNKTVKKFLDVSNISFAPMDFAVEASGMEYGSITVVGLPADWPILIDKSLVEKKYLVVGGGLRSAKLLVPGKALAELPNTFVIEGLGR
jgi:prolyl-tRNA editing enzyme YbaK/EbsC (Cys-tRNA(Pro) deacylase)